MKANHEKKLMNNKNLCIYFLSSLLTVRSFCHMSCGTSLLTWLCVCLANFTRGTFVTIGQQRVLVGNSIIFMLTITHNCKQKSCFLFLSIPAVVSKVVWFQNTTRDFSYSKKYILLHYNVVSRMCFHLYYFYNVSPLKISNHNAFYNFLSGYDALNSWQNG